MRKAAIPVASMLAILAIASPASAQLTAAKDGPVVYGHHHLNVTSISEHKKFWADTLGGTAIKIGASEVVKFPNVLVFLTQRAPSGGTKGTTMNHVGFQVPDARAVVNKLRAAGYPIVTRAELPAVYEENDGLGFIPDQNTYIAFTMGPDDIKVEFIENKGAMLPIALHHLHFAAPNVNDMRAWYVKALGAKAGKRGSFEAADLPGVNLTYSPASERVRGTKGRVLDHIGFEVKDLEAFCRKLEGMGIKLDGAYTKLPAMNIAFAIVADPWGTYVELTEGLDKY